MERASERASGKMLHLTNDALAAAAAAAGCCIGIQSSYQTFEVNWPIKWRRNFVLLIIIINWLLNEREESPFARPYFYQQRRRIGRCVTAVVRSLACVRASVVVHLL